MFHWERSTRRRLCRTPEDDRMRDRPVPRASAQVFRAPDHLSAIKPNCCAMRINCNALSAPNFCLIDDW